MRSSADPDRVAEDDRRRSRYMRDLIQGTPQRYTGTGSAKIPKVIIQFWHDSGAIPSDVNDCLHSWEQLLRGGFRRIIFDDHRARGFIAQRFGAHYATAFDRCGHPAMRCDYFRLCYISRHGGFYVDADDAYQGGDCESLFRDNMLKVQPLCYDTRSGNMVEPEVFVRTGETSPNWTFYVNNNPLVAPPEHPVVQSALARSTRILLSAPPGITDIQSATGPGNLTASLVRHSIESELSGKARDFAFLTDWADVSVSRWPLSYRQDQRNWRLWNPPA